VLANEGMFCVPAQTTERLEQALVSLAWLVDTYGPQYTPLYEAAEKWLAEARASEATRDRIKRTLATNHNRLPTVINNRT
jgi:hypothetical protein